MTVAEKAAYLKGLTEGLGVEPDSRDGKLWGALNDLLGDIAHELEDLQATSLDYAETIDNISEDLQYLEELTCDLDMPEDFCDEDSDESCCGGDCSGCHYVNEEDDEDEDDEDDEDDEAYDGVMYDVTCPSCGKEISFDEETLELGSIECPSCGETLEFDLSDEEE